MEKINKHDEDIYRFLNNNDYVTTYISLNQKALLNVKEICLYTGWGENTVRNELNHPRCTYVVHKGNRLYANRRMLDKYLDSITGI